MIWKNKKVIRGELKLEKFLQRSLKKTRLQRDRQENLVLYQDYTPKLISFSELITCLQDNILELLGEFNH